MEITNIWLKNVVKIPTEPQEMPWALCASLWGSPGGTLTPTPCAFAILYKGKQASVGFQLPFLKSKNIERIGILEYKLLKGKMLTSHTKNYFKTPNDEKPVLVSPVATRRTAISSGDGEAPDTVVGTAAGASFLEGDIWKIWTISTLPSSSHANQPGWEWKQSHMNEGDRAAPGQLTEPKWIRKHAHPCHLHLSESSACSDFVGTTHFTATCWKTMIKCKLGCLQWGGSSWQEWERELSS